MKALSFLSPNTTPLAKHAFSKVELEQCADGLLFGAGNAQLPTSPLLMLDRIVDIQATGGEYGRGYAIAEIDIDPSKWYLKSHFKADPVMPGSLLAEAVWQLSGFHLAWSGYKGKGRILDSGNTRFIEPVLGTNNVTLIVTIHVRKVFINRNPMAISDGDIRHSKGIVCLSKKVSIGLFN